MDTLLPLLALVNLFFWLHAPQHLVLHLCGKTSQSFTGNDLLSNRSQLRGFSAPVSFDGSFALELCWGEQWHTFPQLPGRWAVCAWSPVCGGQHTLGLVRCLRCGSGSVSPAVWDRAGCGIVPHQPLRVRVASREGERHWGGEAGGGVQSWR